MSMHGSYEVFASACLTGVLPRWGRGSLEDTLPAKPYPRRSGRDPLSEMLSVVPKSLPNLGLAMLICDGQEEVRVRVSY